MLDRQDPIGASTFPVGRTILHGGGDAPDVVHQVIVRVMFLVEKLAVVALTLPSRLPLPFIDPRCGKFVEVECMLPAFSKLDRSDMMR